MKGAPRAGTISRITPLIVAPGIELLFPQTPVPKLVRSEKACSHYNSKIEANIRVVWRAGDAPTSEFCAAPFYDAIDGWWERIQFLIFLFFSFLLD